MTVHGKTYLNAYPLDNITEYNSKIFTVVFCDIVQVNTKVSDALVNDI